MAAAEVRQVRLNTNETTDDLITDDDIDALVAARGVNGASAAVWSMKMAQAADLVDTTEAGASHSFSDLREAAGEMVDYYGGLEFEETGTADGPRVSKIERS